MPVRKQLTYSVLIGVLVACCCEFTAAAANDVLPNGEVSLARLVDLAADQINVSVEYDASDVRGSITLRLEGALEPADLWSITNDVLASRGLTTIRRGQSDQLLGVVKLQDAAREVFPHRDLDAIRAPVPGFIAVDVALQHITPAVFLAQVERLLTPSVGVLTDLPEPGYVRVADLASTVDEVVGLASVLDHPDARDAFRLVPLRSLQASEVIRLVDDIRGVRGASPRSEPARSRLIEGMGGGTVLVTGPVGEIDEISELIEQLDAQAERVSRLYSPANFALSDVAALIRSMLEATASDPPAVIVEDELTSTLQITAVPADHDRIADLLERLGSVPAESRRPLRTYSVRNRDVEEIASLVRDLIDAGLLDAGGAVIRGDRGIEAAGPPTAIREPAPVGFVDQARDPADSPSDRIKIAVDRSTSRLIAIGEPRDLDRVSRLIEELDVRQPQVMLEVLMVSLSDGKSLDFGIELQRLLDDAGTLVGLTSLFGISDLGLSGEASDVLGRGSGGTAVVLDPGDFSVVVRALENISDGRSLSMPRLLVNNNESGTINSTVEEPFLSTNASDTVATTSFGGSSAAGTQVNLTPQIAEGDHIVLQYSISLSSFVGESADPALPPPRQQNSISSSATIPDEYTIVVGGIEIQSEAEAETRVPLLGEIPGIGELFKSRSRSNSRSRFFAFIRPSVMRHESFEDLKYFSGAAREAATIDGSFPTLSPRIIR